MFAKSRRTKREKRAKEPKGTHRRPSIPRLSSLPLVSCISLHLKHISIMGGHHHYNPEAEPRKEQDLEAIKKAQIPLAWRDTCSHILIDLNKCRRDTWWNPNKCEHERHTFEECEYNAYLQRVEAKVQLNKHGK